MGNRATIVTKKKDMGVYLHWFGSAQDVVPVLYYCRLRGYRPPEVSNYGWARLCQVLGNYVGGELSVGIYPYDKLPLAFDNGAYVIERWKVVEHNGQDGEPGIDDLELFEKIHEVDRHMPRHEQLGAYIDADVIPTEKVEVGTVIWGWNGEYPQKYTVLGFGPDSAQEELRGRPYVNFCKEPGKEYWENECNYLTEDFMRIEPQQDRMSLAMRGLFGRPLSELR